MGLKHSSKDDGKDIFESGKQALSSIADGIFTSKSQ